MVSFFRLNAKLVAELNEDFESGAINGFKAKQIPKTLAHDRDIADLTIIFATDLMLCPLQKLGISS
jgi:hypothetical protein